MKFTSLGTLRIPTAKGPGVHADELDSAWETIRGMLSPAAARQLLALDGAGGEGTPRANGRAKKDDDEEEKEDATISTVDLAYPTMLVTGQWGPPPRAKDRNRSLLPVVRSNPDVVKWDVRPFFARMKVLSGILGRMASSAREKYQRAGVTDLRKQGWAWALLQCQADVDWVLAQESAARRGAARVVGARDGKAYSVMGISTGVEGDRRGEAARVAAKGRFYRQPWGIVAAKGNGKLPFAAYSTAPMASCPGAGGCATNVNPSTEKLKGYCYSFKAWRYPDAFARQFRNLLAETTDREFAIMAGGGPEGPVGGSDDGSRDESSLAYVARVKAALTPAGRAARTWHRLVALEVVRALTYRIKGGRGRPGVTGFFRLYVDGDVATEDNILEWMQVCFDIGPGRGRAGGALVSHLPRHIEVYGYSKCWAQFVNARRFSPLPWPSNYSLNMSADSVYRVPGTDGSTPWSSIAEKDLASFKIQQAAWDLPIRRGYFEATDLHQSIRALTESLDPSSPTGFREYTVPPPSQTPFPFDEGRIKTLLTINRDLGTAAGDPARMAVIAQEIANRLGVVWVVSYDTKDDSKQGRIDACGKIRGDLYKAYFAKLMSTTDFGRIVERELAQDSLDRLIPRHDRAAEAQAIAAWKAKSSAKKVAAAVARAVETNTSVASATADTEAKQASPWLSKKYIDKALALSLHEVLWAFGKGGSCPLVCGNCSDATGDAVELESAVHRCASKTTFRGPTIYIGLH